MKNKIGFTSAIALVTGNMIGSGIFLLPASLAAYKGVGIIGWIIATIGAILLSFVFGKLGEWFPNTTGGPYAYTRIYLGQFAAFWVAWGYWISIWITNAAIAVAFVGYLGVFFPVLKTDLLYSLFAGIGVIWFFTWINSKNIRDIGFVQKLTTALKILPILFVIVFGVFYSDISVLISRSFYSEISWGNVTTVIMISFFSFLGLESATVPSNQIENGSKIIKKATILGTVFTAFLYTLSFIVIIGIIPPETLAKSEAPFADVADILAGSWGKYFIAFGALVSTMGALNGWILIQGQIPFAAAKDELFPPFFKRTNRHLSPIKGIVLSSILATVLMALNYTKSLVEAFTFMITLSTLSVLLPYIFSLASFAIKTKDFDIKKRGYLLVLAAISFLFCIWIVIGCGPEVAYYGLILLLLGMPFYVWLQFKNKHYGTPKHK